MDTLNAMAAIHTWTIGIVWAIGVIFAAIVIVRLIAAWLEAGR